MSRVAAAVRAAARENNVGTYIHEGGTLEGRLDRRYIEESLARLRFGLSS